MSLKMKWLELIKNLNELMKIQTNVQVTHDQYYNIYKTETDVKRLKNISNHNHVNDNLNSVINTIKNNQDKSISNLINNLIKIKLVF